MTQASFLRSRSFFFPSKTCGYLVFTKSSLHYNQIAYSSSLRCPVYSPTNNFVHKTKHPIYPSLQTSSSIIQNRLPLQTQICSFASKDADKTSKPVGWIPKSISFLKTLPRRFKEELIHYWTGTKLLGYEIAICISLLRKITKGKTLTRREKRQLKRTAGDLLRLIPFAFFLVVPFMEFLLPFFLKLFPNMLPSTFHSSVAKEESRRKELKAKIEVAKFLQQVLYDRAKSISTGDQAEALKKFMEQVRGGVYVENIDILRFASLFEDEFTLDQLSREQLLAMSQYMQLPAFGTDSFLRYNLNKKIQQLKADDRVIESEGIETLTLQELQQACAARGLKAVSRSKEYLRERLREWIDLSLNHNLPVSLLILANAFKITGTTAAKDALRDAIYYLPNSLVDSIRLKVAKNQYDANSLKLELLRQESEQIKEEKREEYLTEGQIKERELVEWINKEQDIAQSSVTFTASQLKAMTEAVAALAESSSGESERKQLQELKFLLEKRKKELSEEKERKLAEEKHVADTTIYDEDEDLSLPVPKETEEERKKREKALKEEEREKETLAKISDHLSSWVEDLEEATKISSENIHQVLGLSWDKDKDGMVDLAELQEAAKLYKEQLPDELVHHVIERLDCDNDGKIKIEELRQLAAKYFEDRDLDNSSEILKDSTKKMNQTPKSEVLQDNAVKM